MRAALPAVAAAASSPSTTRTAAAARPSCSPRCAPPASCRCASGSRVPADRAAGRAPPGRRASAVGYVKAFMDGTLGSRTARLLDGTRRRDHVGGRRSPGSSAPRPRAACPVAVHAIGDRANREALDAFAATEAPGARSGCATGSSTRSACTPTTSPRFARLGVTASVQSTHATSDRDVADRLWGERAAHAYPYRALLDAGARLAGGSDAPIEALDPLAGLRAAVLRTADERPPWRPGAGDRPRRRARRVHRGARLAGGRRGAPRPARARARRRPRRARPRPARRPRRRARRRHDAGRRLAARRPELRRSGAGRRACPTRRAGR